MYTVIGDPHAKPDNLDKINTLFDIIEDLGNPCIILGDLLDTKELVRGKCLNLYLERLKASKLKFYILVGNHDYFNLDCLGHSLEPLKLLSNVKIIDTPTELNDFYAIPYIHDKAILSQILATFVTKKPLIGHLDIVGFDYGNGYISEAGLTSGDLKKFSQVISGHYHAYQQKSNITYLGTPFSHSFGESNQEKFIGIWDPKTFNLELIPTPFPRHFTTELDCSKFNAVAINDYDHFRVILKGTQEQIDKIQKADQVKYIEQPTTSAKASIINEADSSGVQFVKWAKEIKGYSDELTSLGLEVLENV